MLSTVLLAASIAAAAPGLDDGAALAEAGRFEEARHVFVSVLASSGSQDEIGAAAANAGFALLELGRTAEAVVSLERALAIIPGTQEVVNALVDAHCLASTEGNASSHLTAAAALRPHDETLLSAAADAYINEAIAVLDHSSRCYSEEMELAGYTTE